MVRYIIECNCVSVYHWYQIMLLICVSVWRVPFIDICSHKARYVFLTINDVFVYSRLIRVDHRI